MARARQSVLPLPTRNYQVTEESRFRDAVAKELRALHDETQAAKQRTDKESSLASRRYQFLLMGAGK